ncbi:amidohydrolase family protein, partial [Deferrisoma palaeochoriense]
MTRSPDLWIEAEGLRRGPRAEALSPAYVLVRGGRVVSVRSDDRDRPRDPLPTLRGGWLVEPLADAHVHLFLPGSFDPADRSRVTNAGREDALERILGLLEDYRARGVAAVRDGGDPRGLALEAARVANPRPERYARVLPAGEALFRKGYYGSFLGRGAAGLSEAEAILRENAAAGATHAKILATGLNSLDEVGGVSAGGFSAGDLGRLCGAARGLGLRVMVHANGPLGAVLATGPDSVEHGFGCDPGDLGRLAAGGVVWVPTLRAWQALEEHPALTGRQKAVVRTTHARHLAEVAEGAARRVSIAAGSDAGTPGVEHGDGLVEELRLLAEALGDPGAALAAATYHARALCEAEAGAPVGGLAEGGPAGFVWLAADPAGHWDGLREPRGVYLGGTWTGADPDEVGGGR